MSLQDLLGGRSAAMKEYLKAVWANKATLAGFTSLAGACALLYAGSVAPDEIKQSVRLGAVLCIDAAAVLIGITQAGIETVHAYRGTREHIRKHQTIDSLYAKSCARSSYCVMTGARLAARESGLEHLLS